MARPLLIFILGKIESDGEEGALSCLCQRNARASRYCIWLGPRQRLKTCESACQGRVQHIEKNATSAKVQLIFTLGKGSERKQTRNISGFIGRLAAAFIGFIA